MTDLKAVPPPETDGAAQTPASAPSPNAHRIPEAPMGDLARAMGLCYVFRWSTFPLYRMQSVAEHSYRVAAIARALTEPLQVAFTSLATFTVIDRGSVASLALDHDLEEALTGDVVSTTKGPQPMPDSLSKKILKLADLIEAFTYLGNYGMPSQRRQRALDRYRESIAAYQDAIRADHSVDLASAVDSILNILREAR